MQRHSFLTALGELWAWSPATSLSSKRPLVLFINGAFSIERPRSFELHTLLPGADVLVAHLPGTHCPYLSSDSVEAYGSAYAQMLDQIGRPCVVVGASIGALVGLSIRSGTVGGQVIIEPPLQTGKLWCLVQPFRDRIAKNPDDQHLGSFLDNVFGITANGFENRDYRPLVETLNVPGWAVFGELPLFPQRPLNELPSLVDEPERALLRAHPMLTSEVVPTVGHNVPGRAISYVRRYTQNLLDRMA
jgi:hypothetical protein